MLHVGLTRLRPVRRIDTYPVTKAKDGIFVVETGTRWPSIMLPEGFEPILRHVAHVDAYRHGDYPGHGQSPRALTSHLIFSRPSFWLLRSRLESEAKEKKKNEGKRKKRERGRKEKGKNEECFEKSATTAGQLFQGGGRFISSPKFAVSHNHHLKLFHPQYIQRSF